MLETIIITHTILHYFSYNFILTKISLKELLKSATGHDQNTLRSKTIPKKTNYSKRLRDNRFD